MMCLYCTNDGVCDSQKCILALVEFILDMKQEVDK